MTNDFIVWLLQGAGLAILIWGAWLCFAGRDRRAGHDRRSVARGGRRIVDGRKVTAMTQQPANTATPQEQAARMVA